MYKKDLEIQNPKKFQRYVADVANDVLYKKGYHLDSRYSKLAYLRSNGIANIADFYGVLCYVKNHRNYNLISRIIGSILIGIGILYYFNPPPIPQDYTELGRLWNWIAPLIFIGIGLCLIWFKFGKVVCIEIKLLGESYRTDSIMGDKSIEYLDVRSNARLSVHAVTLDPRKSLSDNDVEKLHKDGSALTGKLDEFLEKYLEKNETNY